VKAEDFRYGRGASQSTELPARPIAKGPGWSILQDANDVAGTLSALTFGELAGGRRRASVVLVDNDRAITYGPNVEPAAQAHIRVRHKPTFLFGSGKVLEQ
jgi:hypothetical protein